MPARSGDASFGEFARQLTYKSDWCGKILVAVDRQVRRLEQDLLELPVYSMSCGWMPGIGRAPNAKRAMTETSMPHGIC